MASDWVRRFAIMVGLLAMPAVPEPCVATARADEATARLSGVVTHGRVAPQ